MPADLLPTPLINYYSLEFYATIPFDIHADTETGKFVYKDPRKDVNLKYAILSHTWDPEGEQTYQVLQNIQQRHDSQFKPSDPRRSPTLPSPVSATGSMTTSPGQHWLTLLLGQLQFLTGHVLNSIWGLLALLLASVLPRRIFESVRNIYRLDHSPIPSTLASIHPDIDLSPHSPPTQSPSNDSPPLFGEGQPETPPRSIWGDPELSPKIRDACAVARANGYQYIWIDSCCIDKTSSAELSEAINSMYAWYARAEICYAFLADVPPSEDHRKPRSDFRGSLWFTRGWTLQELIAPLDVLFLSGDWAPIGPKYALADLIEEITGISEEALLHVEPLDRFSVAQRLSWAAGRETTRVEDQAYSLLGIFDINMPTLYGEGERAFRRLQEEIMQRVPDQSLFAWGEMYLGPSLFKSLEHNAESSERPPRISFQPQVPTSPLAMAPRFFAECRTVSASSHEITRHVQVHFEYLSSPYGIRTQFQMLPLSLLFPPDSLHHRRRRETEEDSGPEWYLALLGCQHAARRGHLLGRVCYVNPSESGVDFVYPGYVHVSPKSLLHGNVLSADLFLVPPEVVECCRPHMQPRTVYISHPDRHDHKAAQADTSQPHHSINFVLLTKTREALREQGYTVGFCGPEKSDQTATGIHSLTLSHDKHTVTVKLQHTLESDGQQLTITARVAISDRNVLGAAEGSASPKADPNTVTWTDSYPWRARLGQHKGVRLDTGDAEALILRLRLDLICAEAYLLYIDLLPSNDPPAVALSSPTGLLRAEGEVAGIDALGDVPRDPENVHEGDEHT